VNVTVITPSIPDRVDKLMECMVSVANQTEPASAHLVRIQSPRDGRLSSAHISDQRNALLSAVQTEWVATLDDDDLMLPDHLAQLATKAEPGVDVIYSLAVDTPPERCFDVSEWEPEYLAGVLEGDNLFPTTVAVRTSTLVALGGWASWDDHIGGFQTGVQYEDWDLWRRMARAGCSFRHVPAETWIYRRGDWPRITN